MMLTEKNTVYGGFGGGGDDFAKTYVCSFAFGGQQS